ncbi:DUF4935 domain-containing protein [Massilia antarctica]|uniref:DUF4935 domain-containing protein n=1 Tax=Massilia antarctica TaxID=2765360 RepID=A0AA48W9Z9_9BURK|nr:PIN-like domain-containing protein [Massilia antarctica]QPI47699.1 DUF4935 domain-containing protein [Massilia antarctica]
MREFFSSYAPSNFDYPKIWKDALFVIDANVLLNLYRYQEKTSKEFLDLLFTLKGRVWISNYAALEFHRNRLSVIADQNLRFGEVKKIATMALASVEKDMDALHLSKRHRAIDPAEFLNDFKLLVEKFAVEVDGLERSKQGLLGEDALLQKIYEIFDGRVGEPYSQKILDEIYENAEIRYRLDIPPGYKDREKKDRFRHNGINYQAKYGDFLVWKQLLDKTAADNIKNVVFITGDLKEDWWKIVGPEKIGPRPELLEEAAAIGKVDAFLMYRPEVFLARAKHYVDAIVSDEALAEVRDANLAAASEGNNFDLVKFVASQDPRAAIIQAWLHFELAAIERLMKLGLAEKNDSIHGNSRLGHALLNSNIINKKEFELFHELREQRNWAAHNVSEDVAISVALNFIQSIERLVAGFM